MNLKEEIESHLDKCVTTEVRKEYEARLAEDDLLRDDGATSHFCAYFVPYNPETKQILIGDHKKSGLWLMPGGHIDADEMLTEAVNREIEEELGVAGFFSNDPEPFLCTITNIERVNQSCHKHFDLWYLMSTDGADFKVDYTEYNEVRWLSIAEARNLTADPANLAALDVLDTM